MSKASAVKRIRDNPMAERTEIVPPLDGALALRLAVWAREAGDGGLILAASGEAGAERLSRLLWAMMPDAETIMLPPWDCLPYDRVSPSAWVMGLRNAAIDALSRPGDRPRLLVTTPEALLQRLPPHVPLADATRPVTVGEALDLDALASGLAGAGYRQDERVDEAGEFAIRGQVVDIFPAGYRLPVRVVHDDGRVTSITSYDAATQRRTDEFERLVLRPASEVVIGPEAELARQPGIEHRLPLLYDRLATVFDLMPGATVALAPDALARAASFLDMVTDAHETRARSGGSRPLAPDRLYLTRPEFDAALGGRAVIRIEPAPDGAGAVPRFAASRSPGREIAAFVSAQRDAGRAVIVAGERDEDRTEAASRVARATGLEVVAVERWADAVPGPSGAIAALALPLGAGFVSETDAVAAVAAADVLGTAGRGRVASATLFDATETEFGIGDAVIHLDHGVGILLGIETVQDADGQAVDTIRLGYAHDATLLVPTDDIRLMWRYGAGHEWVALDRLDGESWPKRRAKVEREIERSAAALADSVRARRAVKAPKLAPDRQAFERFVARFPFTVTPDQSDAVAAVLADLGSGRVMDRLLCGDVGFGKTEVALRAAAAAALAGKQVAVAAPTTVLARQHLQTFERRFAGTGLAVGHLSRLVTPAEVRDVKAGLADGRIRVVVGTHALAGKGVEIPDLGLLVIDEEQRFGAADKAKLRALGETAHVLTLTATPIPRTLQAALVGLQDLSVLATPPAERQPVRTVVAPFDDGTVREALLRERRRGGQSFVVCPRIADIGPMAERLTRLVPELVVRVAHGKLPPAEVDETMVLFGDGDGDVLLATNIIESGLDVPRANTLVVYEPERFGLAQLHQLRGRVGRGRVRGVAYLMSEAGTALPDATRRRLENLETLDRLGAGFAISGEDLDERGAGDLIGDTQSGHIKLIGAGLYRRLLERAIVTARDGQAPEEWSPELHIGLTGRIPESYVPEPEVRLNLYARVARLGERESAAAIAEELEDRFGPLPPDTRHLLALARLRQLALAADVARVDAGAKAVALTFRTRRESDPVLTRVVAAGGASWKGRRLLFPGAAGSKGVASSVAAILRRVATPARSRPRSSADKAPAMA